MTNNYVKKGLPCDNFHTTTINKRLKFILDNCGLNENKIILDIGSGYGVYEREVCGDVKQVLGIDIDISNIRKTKFDNIPDNLELFLASGNSLPFKNNSFHVVILIEVLEHLEMDVQSLEEIYRVLKPDGILIITAPNKLFPFETHGFRIGSRQFGTKGLGFPILPLFPDNIRIKFANARVYSLPELKNLLQNAGFQIQKISYFGPGLDQVKNYFPKYISMIQALNKFLDKIENMYGIRLLMTTIIVSAKKNEI